jgi:hypothetical protein
MLKEKKTRLGQVGIRIGLICDVQTSDFRYQEDEKIGAMAVPHVLSVEVTSKGYREG